jgi:lauroyl/myristoyl acyltransferase
MTEAPLYEPLVPQDDRLTDVSLLARLHGNKHVHRLMPARLAVPLAAWLGPVARQLRDPAELRVATEFMSDLLLYTPRSGEARKLARRWMREKARLNELVWRPWLLKHSRFHGMEHWEAVRRDGRGCFVVFGHQGAYWVMPTLLSRLDAGAHVVGIPAYWEPLPPGYLALQWLHRRREYLEKPLSGAARYVSSLGPPERQVELLRAGKPIGIAFDVPGSVPTPFLGRSIALGGATVRLAHTEGVSILPASIERQGIRIDVRIHPPIHAADHADVRSMNHAMARTFESIVLAQPESLHLYMHPSPLVTETARRNVDDQEPARI